MRVVISFFTTLVVLLVSVNATATPITVNSVTYDLVVVDAVDYTTSPPIDGVLALKDLLEGQAWYGNNSLAQDFYSSMIANGVTDLFGAFFVWQVSGNPTNQFFNFNGYGITENGFAPMIANPTGFGNYLHGLSPKKYIVAAEDLGSVPAPPAFILLLTGLLGLGLKRRKSLKSLQGL